MSATWRRLAQKIAAHALRTQRGSISSQVVQEFLNAALRKFTVPAWVMIWLGQLVSILASQMSQFAFTVWAFEKTGSATALGLVQVFFIAPFLLIPPVAGVMIDRYNRKLMMLLSDLGAVAASGLVLVFALNGQLEMWHLYVASAVNGLFSAFQWPA